MAEMDAVGSFEEQVLVGILRTGDEAYGMAVRRELEEVSGREVAIGAVYATLDRLEAKGLVSSTRGTGAGARRPSPPARPASGCGRGWTSPPWPGRARASGAR